MEIKETLDKKEIKILMLEDLSEDVFLIERALKKENFSYQKHLVDTEEGFVDGLKVFAPDIILSDHSLPLFNSTQALKICKNIDPDVPFILVTGTVSEEFAITILKQGASDYILKSNLARLVPAIYQALEQKELKKKKDQAEEALRQQNEELKRVNNELDRFVYSASHDLRSPLTGLMGLVAIAQEQVSNPVVLVDYLQKMQTSVEKLDGILNDILEYSYNARFNITFEKIDLKALIAECFSKLEHIPGFDQIDRQIKIRQNADLVFDRYRLSTILCSLVKNAIHFLDTNKKSAYIQLDIDVSDRLTILFKDNGIGIKSDVLPKIFDLFYRGSSLSKGAGLGLYIIKEIITKLQGKIHVDSVLGEYTTVTITLPIAKPINTKDQAIHSSL